MHFDSDTYLMRIALVETVGVLVCEISLECEEDRDNEGCGAQEGQEHCKRKISKFFDLLLERFCDASGYVCLKVLQTISKLLK